jgi:HJR/Mrr/RecB family endonuclease
MYDCRRACRNCVVIIAAAIIGLLGVQSHKQSQARLLQHSELRQADAMTGSQFESYFADLLHLRGYRGVRVVGGAGDGGIDILATAPDGKAIACQCKRQVANVSVQVVRQLIGSVSFEHRGGVPWLVTTAILTGPASDLARQYGVHVVDRPALGQLMAEARQQLSGAATPAILPQGQAPLGPVKVNAAVQVGWALMAIGQAVLVVIGVMASILLQVLAVAVAPQPRSRRRRRSPARRRSSRKSAWWA